MTCYMERPEEIAKYAKLAALKGEPDTGAGALPLFMGMASGDKDLFELMWAAWNFENAWDDLLDETALDPERKELAMSKLHDVITALMADEPSVNRMEFSGREFKQVWLWLSERARIQARWTRDRTILAATARNRFFECLETNVFVQKHRAEIRAMLVQCMMRCLAGDLMAKSDNAERRQLSPAVRCGDVDLFIHLIYLARGWAAAQVWSERRDYDLPDDRQGAGANL